MKNPSKNELHKIMELLMEAGEKCIEAESLLDEWQLGPRVAYISGLIKPCTRGLVYAAAQMLEMIKEVHYE